MIIFGGIILFSCNAVSEYMAGVINLHKIGISGIYRFFFGGGCHKAIR